MEVSLIIKVTYGGISRRFREGVDANGNLAVDMTGLKDRIFELFHIPPGTNVSITYVDDDNYVMYLIDDGDLREAMAQGLRLLKITVVNNERVEQDVQQWLNELGQAVQQNIQQGENEDGGRGTTTPPPNAGSVEPRVNESRQVPPQQNIPQGREDEDGGNGTTTPPFNAGGDKSWFKRLIDFFWMLRQKITVTMLMGLITFLLKHMDHITSLLKHMDLPPWIREEHLLLILKHLFSLVNPMPTM